MALDPVTLALAKKYTAETAEGMGAVQGQPGSPGKDALVNILGSRSFFLDIVGNDDPAKVGEYRFNTGVSAFNRTPEIGETWFSPIIYYNEPSERKVVNTFIAQWEIVSVSPNVSSLLKWKSTIMGPTGDTGEPGLEYLVFNAFLETQPELNGRYYIQESDFNRTPVDGENCSGVGFYGGITYYMTGKVIWNSIKSQWNVSVSKVSRLTGQDGQGSSGADMATGMLMFTAVGASVPTKGSSQTLPATDFIGIKPKVSSVYRYGLCWAGVQLYHVTYKITEVTSDFVTVEFVEKPELVVQSIEGPQGEPGDDALVYKDFLVWTNVSEGGDPAVVNLYDFAASIDYFNRVPKLGETWFGVMIYYSDADQKQVSDVFIGNFKITGISDSDGVDMYASLLTGKQSVMPEISGSGGDVDLSNYYTKSEIEANYYDTEETWNKINQTISYGIIFYSVADNVEVGTTLKVDVDTITGWKPTHVGDVVWGLIRNTDSTKWWIVISTVSEIEKIGNNVTYVTFNVTKFLEIPNPANYFTRTEIDTKLEGYVTKEDAVNVYKFKGSVPKYENLPTSEQTSGDVYNVEDTGMNYGWVVDAEEENGGFWDPLGGTVQKGTTFTPSVSNAGIISWTNDGGLTNPDPVDIKGPAGTNGANGSDGISPTVSVASNEQQDGTIVTITDVNGAKSFEVLNGENGATFTPAVSADGILSWTNNGDLENPASVNIKGSQGPTGLSALVFNSSNTATTAIPKPGDTLYINAAEFNRTPKQGEDCCGIFSIETDLYYVTGYNTTYVGSGTYTIQARDVYKLIGPAGPQGNPGSTFTPAVSDDGTLTWTNNGGLPNPEPVNIKGPPGEGGGSELTVGDGLTKDGDTLSVTKPVRSMLTQAEYDSLTDADKEKGLYIVTGEGGSGGGSTGGSSLDVYSTEETRIGTWIDGKPIYRMVFQKTLGNSNDSPIAVLDNDVESIINLRGFIDSSVLDSIYTIPVTTSVGNTQLYYKKTNKTVYVNTGSSSFKSQPATIILEYTKTTDEPEVSS